MVKKTLVLLCLALALCACVFSACGSGTEGEEQSAAVLLDADTLGTYEIVRRDIPADEEIRYGMELRAAFVEAGQELRLTTDFTREGVDTFAVGEKEILIGETDRDESRAFLSALRPWQWGYALIDGKICIAGHNVENTGLALEKFISDIVQRSPLRWEEGDGYIDGAVYEGDGELVTVLAARSGADGDAEKILAQALEKSPAVLMAQGLTEADEDMLSAGLENYIKGARLASDGTAIWYDASRFTYSAADSLPLLNYANLAEEERGALLYLVLRSRETKQKLIFAASLLNENAELASEMRTVSAFLENSSSIPAVVAGFSDGTRPRIRSAANPDRDALFFSSGWANALGLLDDPETPEEYAKTADLYVPYTRIAAESLAIDENGFLFAGLRPAKAAK